MRDLDHPNIVNFCEIYVSRDYFYIVMQYYSGMNLREYINSKGRLQENEAKKIFF